MIDLGTLLTASGSSGQSWAYGINDQGVVVGASDNSLGGLDAFYFQTSVAGARMVAIPFGSAPGAGDSATALAINNTNQIVGTYYSSTYLETFPQFQYTTPGYVAFTYPIGGTVTYPGFLANLGFLDGLQTYLYPTAATAINSAGMSVGGGTDYPGGGDGAFLYNPGFNEYFGLPGLGYQAFGINSSNIIVGSAGGAGAVQWALVATKNNPKSTGYYVTVLGPLPSTGDHNGAAYGINTAGQIVGSSDVANATPHAFIYQSGKMTDLNDLIVPGQNGGFVTLSVATAINDAGAIVGYGQRAAGGAYFAFLAIPTVPTPVP
jgi:probable HAF family extracellular repeat protein